MNYLSLCSGIEAATTAWHRFGWTPLAFSEIEPFPSAVLAHHWPHVPNLGDMTRWHEWPDDLLVQVDVLVGGTPCFTAGHLVLTKDGFRPIEDLRVGDEVVTHEGRLRRILRTGSEMKQVGVLKILGRPENITCTADHPFRSVKFKNQNTKRSGAYARVERCGEPDWTPAGEMKGHQWCALTTATIESDAPDSRLLTDEQAMLLAGYYLGDGWIRKWGGKAKLAVCLGLNAEKYEMFLRDFPGIIHSKSVMRTSIRVTLCDTRLAQWLTRNFARYSHFKNVPAWALSHPHRSRILEGYSKTDGYSKDAGKFGASTTSRALAYGVASLAETLGHTTSVKTVPVPPTTIIEGRVVNQRPFWQVSWSLLHNLSKARVRHGYLLRKAKSFTSTGVERVFNIEVEDDHSYVLNGAVVHNCQAFSVAGLRNSLSDERGNLTLIYAHLLDHIDSLRWAAGLPPVICVWENVPGVLTTKDNAFGCFLGALAGEDDALIPSGDKWTYAGLVRGPSRAICWRTLDAQYFGVAQRRRRVFLVASARNGFRPEEVLFEPEGVRRDSAPGREAREVAPTIPARSLGGGGLGTDFDCDGGLVGSWWDGSQVSQTLDAVLAKGQMMPEKNRFPVVLAPDVRRLTVTECCRLQGFPDDHATIPWKKKPAEECPDGPRYKALGNSMAVPCMAWIGNRLNNYVA